MVDDIIEASGSPRQWRQDVLVKTLGEDPPAAQRRAVVEPARYDDQQNRLACHR